MWSITFECSKASVLIRLSAERSTFSAAMSSKGTAAAPIRNKRLWRVFICTLRYHRTKKVLPLFLIIRRLARLLLRGRFNYEERATLSCLHPRHRLGPEQRRHRPDQLRAVRYPNPGRRQCRLRQELPVRAICALAHAARWVAVSEVHLRNRVRSTYRPDRRPHRFHRHSAKVHSHVGRGARILQPRYGDR